MEVTKDQPSADASAGKSSKLRYPLRSGSKTKDDISTSSATKRARPVSKVSQSVSILDLSGKEKSAKPPRRLSIPTKSAISPLPRPTAFITPISEARMKRTTKAGTPSSDASKSSTTQRKFSVISSSSYWLSQIKLSESAAKHSISLGFFKLAMESGCEPMQRMRDELKSYVARHNLVEHEETVKDLLRSYNISEDLEQLLVSSVSCSDEDLQRLKPKSLNSESFQSSSGKKTQVNKSRGLMNIKSPNLKPSSNLGSTDTQKKSQRSSNVKESNKEVKPKKDEKKSTVENTTIDPSPDVKIQQEDKENMDSEKLEDIRLTEVV